MNAPPHRFAALLLLFVLASPLAAEVRTWRDQETDTAVDAELVKAEGDQITLKLANGKTFTYPVTRFHDDDQFYVKEWIAEKAVNLDREMAKIPAPPHVQKALQVVIKPVKQAGETERTGEKDTKGKKRADSTHYEVTLTNARGGPEMKDVTVDYTIYTRSETSDTRDRNAGRTLFVEENDSVKLESLLPGTSGSASTKAVIATESTTGYVQDKKSYEKRLSETVIGVHVKVLVEGATAKTIEFPPGLLRTVEKGKEG